MMSMVAKPSWKIQFGKLKTTIKYLPDVIMKKLNLLLKKEERSTDNLCKIFIVIENLFKEKIYR